MGYADEIMKLKDGDGDAEVYIERLPGDSEDGAVLEVEVAIGAGSGRREGYIRLGRESLSKLAEWLGMAAGTEGVDDYGEPWTDYHLAPQPDELAQLRAERDALRARVEALTDERDKAIRLPTPECVTCGYDPCLCGSTMNANRQRPPHAGDTAAEEAGDEP